MDIVEQLKEKSTLSEDNFLELIKTNDPALRNRLFEAAQEAVTYLLNRKIYLQGVLPFTNHCPRNCFYCNLRAENKDLKRYRMNWEQIRAACREGYNMGLRTFVLESGEDPYYTDMIMCNILMNLKEEFPDCAITLAMGERSKASYTRMFKAGADRYLLRFETADPLHFSRLHPPSYSLSTKINCLNDLKEIGYETDTGFIVGAPYEMPDYLVRDLTLMQELSPHAISLSPFVPKEGTSFRRHLPCGVETYLRMVAILRVMFPKANIAAPYSLRHIHLQGQVMAVLAGANVLRIPILPPKDMGDLPRLPRVSLLRTLQSLDMSLEPHGFQMVVDRGDSKLKKKGTPKLAEMPEDPEI
jgi:biotin synthase